MNIKIGKYNLAGDAWNEKVSNLRIQWQRSVIVQPHFRAAYPKIRDGDNQTATITFQVARLHSNYRAALAFMLDHGSQLPATGTVLIEEETGDGIVRRQFEMAACQTFGVPQRIGVTTIHEYQIIGTKLTTPR